ncbi:MAG: DNA polymerase III subunit delta [Ruminococcus sp.]
MRHFYRQTSLTNGKKAGIVNGMKSVMEDIKKNEFKHVYLFCGEEDYLKNQYRDKLCEAWNTGDDTMNFSVFKGKGQTPGEIIDLGETLPFLSDRRVILLEDTGFFKGQCEKLPEYLGQLPEYLYLLFVESEVDKRSRMYKAVKNAGRVVEFSSQTESTLMKWVLGILKREGKQITRADMEFFLAGTGSDMNMISHELDKLLSYTMGKDVITRGDIEAVCSVQVTNRIFDMVRAVATRNQKQALSLYYDLLELKEPPMRILFLLARQFRYLLQVKELTEEGVNQKDIAAKTGLQGFVVRNYMEYARGYSAGELKGAVNDFLQAEEDVKTGRLADTLSVELMIIKYSKKDSH